MMASFKKYCRDNHLDPAAHLLYRVEKAKQKKTWREFKDGKCFTAIPKECSWHESGERGAKQKLCEDAKQVRRDEEDRNKSAPVNKRDFIGKCCKKDKRTCQDWERVRKICGSKKWHDLKVDNATPVEEKDHTKDKCCEYKKQRVSCSELSREPEFGCVKPRVVGFGRALPTPEDFGRICCKEPRQSKNTNLAVQTVRKPIRPLQLIVHERVKVHPLEVKKGEPVPGPVSL